jgi:hypothetical protein
LDKNSQLITLKEEGIYYLYNFVPSNSKECDLDLSKEEEGAYIFGMKQVPVQ